MPIQLNHTIVASRDSAAAARFLSELMELPAPVKAGPFSGVQVGETTLDFIDSEEVHPQHYAFLVSEAEFDAIFGRIRERGFSYWADPGRREAGRINSWDGGRGVYFDDPSGHLLEIITRPYGSGGSTSTNRHPLFAQRGPEKPLEGSPGKGPG
ncbi:MAG TPA: VOC family protein [Kiloniellales bacterium]|nr:VOC family protein [Kiloniellales bacterium]